MNKKYSATLLCDFYKVSHREQYPEGTVKVYSTWTPRRSFIKEIDKVVFFGMQAFIKEYLIDYFNENFFNRPKDEVVNEYSRVIKHTLGIANPYTKHIEELHDLGYLPIAIRAIPEGIRVPLRVPMMTINNTDGRFFWLTNYLETLISAHLWQPSTSATIAKEYHNILMEYANKTSDHPEAVAFQAHDFSFRGMENVDAAAASGAGHLLSFTGTDTIPAIQYLEFFYNSNIENELIGTSIPATEHSVMCSYGEDELSTYKRFLTEVYPSGFVSIVSDTWDFWNIVTNVLPSLKNEIMNRDGRLVVRPDSGDPVKILCGDPDAAEEAVQDGLIVTLYKEFGGIKNSKGYIELDPHIGAIYGDSITMDRARQICELLEKKGFASTNVVLGVGSFSYQYNTRDTFGFAIKSTYCVVNEEERKIYKNPKTDTNKFKKSQKGMVAIYRDEDGNITFKDDLNEQEWKDFYAVNHQSTLDSLVFYNGELRKEYSLKEVRENILK